VQRLCLMLDTQTTLGLDLCFAFSNSTSFSSLQSTSPVSPAHRHHAGTPKAKNTPRGRSWRPHLQLQRSRAGLLARQ